MEENEDEIVIDNDDLEAETDSWIRDACYVCHEIKRVKITQTEDGSNACLCADCLNIEESLSEDDEDWEEF